jgi:hypothetical protein
MKTKARQFAVAAKDCGNVSDWFAFVDKSQRIKIDCTLSGKIDSAIKILRKKPNTYDSLLMTENEVQVVLKWFSMVPQIVIDNSDIKLNNAMNMFLSNNTKE